MVTDKQQDLELLPVNESEDVPIGEKKSPMSKISGVRRLHHSNSFTGAVPRFGIEVEDELELAQVGGMEAGLMD